MMLTLNTAKDLGVTSRLDPEQSIRGGSEYLSSLLTRIPDRIPSPDRLWFALAAYNIGLGHLEDARVLTERQGGNPDMWVDVKKRLPQLRQKRYYKTTRYGYARGNEAVIYVDNIRRYYDTLVWLNEQQPDLLPVEQTPEVDLQNEPEITNEADVNNPASAPESMGNAKTIKNRKQVSPPPIISDLSFEAELEAIDEETPNVKIKPETERESNDDTIGESTEPSSETEALEPESSP